MCKMLEKLLRGLFGPGNEGETIPDAPATAPEQVSAPPGWEGEPPYRYLDVSRWQGKIKMEVWQAIKDAGYKGVMLRACGNSNSYNPSKAYIDPTFESNYANAKATGLDIGAYYFTKAMSEAEADKELAVLRRALRGKELTMPVAVDMENAMLTVHKPKRPDQPRGLPPRTDREDGVLRPVLHLHELRQPLPRDGASGRAVGCVAGRLHGHNA